MAPIRVFVGYGYNARDAWVEQYVFPLITAFGCSVVHGKISFGGVLADEVVRAIQSADAMVGFTTRRDPIAGSVSAFSTHPWVVQELTTANAVVPRIPWVEVREDGVASPGGILDAANTQRIDYREAERVQCLVAIAQALDRFSKEMRVTTVRLSPEPAVTGIGALLNDPTFICQCQVLRGGLNVQAAQQVPVLPIKGALFVKIHGLDSEDLVRITIQAGGRIWRSDYESVDTADIQMKGGT